jgi:glycosyltransferase involved in cell wall biosynthesis
MQPALSPVVLSFIVPAYNEEQLLGQTLESIHGAALAIGESYEVIVVDDGSSDQTALVAQRHGARVVAVEHRKISATRNSGAKVAMGDFFVFVDADTLVDAPVVQAAIHALRSGAVGGGAAFKFDGAIPWYARLLLPIVVLSFRLTGIATGCFLFCTRSAFFAVGGFDEAYFGAEEIVLSQALGRHGRFKVLRLPVTTSGRKLRTFSNRELWTMLIRMARQGRSGVKQRQGMELWYGERRKDPKQEG